MEKVIRCEHCETTENIYDPTSDYPLCCDCEEEMRVEMHDFFSDNAESTEHLKECLGLS